jgi:hypothetical protein
MTYNHNHPTNGKSIVTIVLFLAWLLNACNMPRKTATLPPGAGAVYTAAAQTVNAQLTPNAGFTLVPLPIATTALPPAQIPTNTPLSPTQIPTHTSVPPSPTPLPCDRAEFVKDVTYPDNSVVSVGESFIKTWRIKNAGACTWSKDYALVFTGGDPLGTPASLALPGYVSPGQSIDLSVTLTAPAAGGTYHGDYKLRNASNVVFGTGPSNKSFYVQIKVPIATGLLYDFIVKSSSAEWKSGVGSTADTTLTFGGADDDPNGVASIKDSVKLENGSTSSKILLTFPKHQDNGFISGLFSPYTVQSGDHFKARLGFMLPGAACGAGKAKFRLNYQEGTTLHTFKEWAKSCNGDLLVVDVDLSSLKGKTVQFMLAVLAGSTSTDDWAIWSSPRIEHP